MNTEQQIITNTTLFVKQQLKNAEGGHDWFHIERVVRNAQQIAKTEPVNTFIVTLAALLHDIADSKFNNGDDTIGPAVAKQFLSTQALSKEHINHIVSIIENCSFKGGKTKPTFSSKELDVVQDADRLDAIGAIGIARTFNYGGFKNRAIYNPDILPDMNMTKEAYKKSTAPTINHFYEKLLLLKELMNTETGKNMAAQRHDFMVRYLDQFYAEWQGER